MQYPAKLIREVNRRKDIALNQRKELRGKKTKMHITLPTLPIVAREYILKGFKFDELQKQSIVP